MERVKQGIENIVADRDYLQNVAIPYYSKELHESLDEFIALKKERNELREKLNNKQEYDTTYTDLLLEVISRAEANSKVESVKEDIKKSNKNIDGNRPKSNSRNKNKGVDN